MYKPVEKTETSSDTFSNINKCVNCKYYHKKTRRTGICYRDEFGILMSNTKKEKAIIVRPIVMRYYNCVHYVR